ncbi:MAG: shikimate dehydrogenase [Halanaerobiaceae bacterium]
MVDVNTKIVGLIGYPLGHSISPLLHNYTIETEKMNYIYLPFSIKPENLQEGIEGMRALNIRGVNVTIPYKEKVIPMLDELDPLASRVGAVNTIVNDDGFLTGYNTDVTGLLRMIKRDGNFQIKGKKAVIVGAGGAARAAGISILSEGISEVYLLNRTLARAEILAGEWSDYYPSVDINVVELDEKKYKIFIDEIDIIIDTTPVGMSPDIDVPPVIGKEYINKNMLVVDLVYNPEETTLIKVARDVGANHLNGLGMLLYQGIESFKLWTGFDIRPSSWWSLIKNKGINK